MKSIAWYFNTFILVIGFISMSAGQEPTYAIYFPKNLRANFPIQMVAEILKNTNPVTFTASLSTPAKEISFVLHALLSEGDAKLLTFDDMIPFDYDGTIDFMMTVMGVDLVTNETLFENSTSELKFNTKALSIFIQTDKAIYQPSQTIKFRAVVTTPDLLPYPGKVSYKITDPDSNLIMQEKDAQLVNGVVGSEFPLGRYSTLGDWKITYEVLNYEESLIVTVDEYKLPKFEMELTPDRTFLHSESTELSGKVSAKFTFGQPVKGEAKLTFAISTTYHYFVMDSYETSFQPFSINYPDFDGEINFNIPINDIKEKLGWEKGRNHGTITITASVKDKNSEVELNDTASITLVQDNIKVEIVDGNKVIKPGLLYHAYVKVTEYDGRPFSTNERENLDVNIQVQYSYPYSGGNYTAPKTELKQVTLREDGLIAFNMTASFDDFTYAAFSVQIKQYLNARGSWSATRFESPSDTYLQITSDKDKFETDETATLTVHTTKQAEAYYFIILSRGKVVERNTFTPLEYTKGEGNYYFNYNFQITRDMFPAVSVFVSFMEGKGEIVADSMTLNVQASLANKVTIETSSSASDTGLPVNITVKASPNSFIGLRAIDRSVLLKKEGNDLTVKKIFDDLNKYRTSYADHPRNYWSPGITNANDIFQRAGLLVFTDAAFFLSKSSNPSYVFQEYDYEEGILDNDIMFNMMAEVGQKLPGAGVSVPNIPAPKVRKEFPETWIWEESNSGETGSRTFTYTLPDTTTTWEISSFAVSDITGLGVTEQNSQIVASRNFFISLDLPATMNNGETLLMKTTVYNFFNTDLQVTLKLEESEWYELIVMGNDTEAAGPIRQLVVPSQDGMTVVFPIEFTKSGFARVKVVALSELAGDAIERTIPVKPEGIKHEQSFSTLIERSGDTTEESSFTFPVITPDNVITGSVYVRLSASGNIMGNALSNVGNLLRIPSGCGEQTMINFAPDVYISLYLKKVNLLTGEIAKKSKSHIRAGYQNELRYQHPNGAFSAFGRGEEGSTWLTSFVIKCFIAATRLNGDLVDSSKIDKGVDFLLKRQLADGSFVEKGLVRHKEMQGGVNSTETITAYTLVSLAEHDYQKEKGEIGTAIIKARTYLEERIGKISDTFSLAIVGYALALSDSSEAFKTLSLLESRAVIEGNLKYWTLKKNEKSQCTTDAWRRSCYSKATSSDIEVTSYILLTLIKMEGDAYLMPIVRWLIEQRGSFGGYDSTQDTVMAIQALATFAGLHSGLESDMTLAITHSENDTFNSILKINDDNSIILQSVVLPTTSGNVIVKATGTGIADVQLATTFNLPSGAQPDEPFTITDDVTERNSGDNVILNICCVINENRDIVIEDTGMFVIAVVLPSGYSANDKVASLQNKNAKLVEFDGNEITGYYDKMSRGKEICMSIDTERNTQVSGLKPQRIRAFDYYQPNQISERMYEYPNQREASVCDVCGSACVGCNSAVRKTCSFLLIVLSIFSGLSFFSD